LRDRLTVHVMAIDLYFVTLSPPSRGVLMLAKHLNIAVNVKNLDVMKGEHMTPQYAKINPAKKVPAIVDQGFPVWESRAIMQYLCNKYAPNSPLYPKDIQKRAVVDSLLYFDTTYYQSLRDALLNKVVRDVEPTDFQLTTYKSNLKLMDRLIGDKRYLSGDVLTIADISALASSTVLMFNDFQDVNDLPQLKAWYERLEKELPYFNEVNGHIPKIIKKLIALKQQNKK